MPTQTVLPRVEAAHQPVAERNGYASGRVYLETLARTKGYRVAGFMRVACRTIKKLEREGQNTSQ